MTARSLRGILAALVILSVPTSVWATGFSVGSTFYLVDISSALAKVPGVATAALQALEVPQADAAQAVAQISAAIADFPTTLPIPLLGGALEISLPFGVIDTLRLAGGILNDGMVRGIANLLGTPIPRPLIDQVIDETGFQGSFSGDLSFSTFSISAEAIKRFDFVLLGVNLGLGLELVQSSVTPEVHAQVPAEYEARIAAGLAALHIDGLSWSTLALRAAVGIEIGPPFLRLVGEARVVLPLYSGSGWWGITVAGWGGTIGLVIRL